MDFYNIYENVFIMLTKYQNWAIEKLDKDKVLSTKVINFEFNGKIVSLINDFKLELDSTIISQKEYFTKHINSILKEDTKQIILIAKNSLGHIIQTYAKANFPNVEIRSYKHRLWYIETPKHVLCSPHRIMTAEEIALMEKIECKSKNNMPFISINDPMVVWCGASVGDLIEIKRMAQNSMALAYRLVVEKLDTFQSDLIDAQD